MIKGLYFDGAFNTLHQAAGDIQHALAGHAIATPYVVLYSGAGCNVAAAERLP